MTRAKARCTAPGGSVRLERLPLCLGAQAIKLREYGLVAGHAEEASPRGILVRRVAEEILSVAGTGVTRVAIDGVDGAGKTTFADEIADALRVGRRQVIRASSDDFLHPREVRYRRGRRSPEGFFLDSYDYAALHECVLQPLGTGGSRRFRRRAFDHHADSRVDAPEETAAADAILVLDGLFLHRDELHQVWDYSVFLDVAPAVSVARCAARDGTSPDPTATSNLRYVVGQQLYLARCTPERRATRVIDNNVLEAPTIRPAGVEFRGRTDDSAASSA